MQLRPYQSDAVERMTAALAADRAAGRRHRTVCGACVGAGKSLLIAEMARREIENNMGRVLVLTHAADLVEQDACKIAAFHQRPGVYCAGLGEKSCGDLVVVASVQSLARKPTACGLFSLILSDESHRISPENSGQYHAILDAQTTADHIGFTGTPWRLNSGVIYGKDKPFDALTIDIRIARMQSDGFLVPIVGKARELMTATALKVTAGEFNTAQQDASIVESQVVSALAQHASDRRSIVVFTPGVRSGEALTAALLQAGEQARWVDGTTPRLAREQATADFKAHRVRYLVNCECLTTGWDAPNTDAVVLLRRTMSSALLIQMVGRGLRLSDGKKDCRVLDYAGNFALHGPIHEIDPPDLGREQKAVKKPRICKQCDEIVASEPVCPSCGWVFPVQDRSLRFSANGQEIDQTATDPGDMVAIFRQEAEKAKRALKPGIIAHIKFKEKTGQWPKPTHGAQAGHPFRWDMDPATNKRKITWL